MHLLLIEDDLDLGNALQKVLRLEQFSSEWVRCAKDARRFIQQQDYDCVLLDLSLPDDAGLSLLREWRHSGRALPIIIITAQSALETRLAGLDGGADDFMLKPFVPAELVARIHAVVRRYARQSHAVWTLGRLEIEPQSHLARLDGQLLELSPREFNLLLELARDNGQVVTKDDLAERLTPMGDPLDFRTLEVHVSNLRRKLGAEFIVTVRGVGYRLSVGQA